MPKIAPSILSANFADLGQEIEALTNAGADLFHLDVMDGHFVPNITFGPPLISSLKKITNIPLDVHLMIEKPDLFAETFIKAGADYLSFHLETTGHHDRTIHHIKEMGAKAGIALNPATPILMIAHLLEDLDFVLIMSVNPGFSGQKFIPYAKEKAIALDRIRRERNLSFLIEIDGGIDQSIAGTIRKTGVDILVSGNAIFSTPDYRSNIAALRERVR